ncbi:MAG: hypothetical protein ACJA08_000919 [Cyclobacteriaceae bacterium]
MNISDIDFSRVNKKTIEKFFIKEKISHTDELIPLCFSEDKGSYSKHTKEYVVKADIDSIWNCYVYLHPTQCWDSDMISFGMMYSRAQKKLYYRDSEYDSLQPGQLYFISLKIIGSIFQIPVIHEISQVDHHKKIIKSCYLKSGRSEGSQWIKLFKIDDHTTKIIHETKYKCESVLREKHLYPYFHSKAVNQFHGNIKEAVGKSELIQEPSSVSDSIPRKALAS